MEIKIILGFVIGLVLMIGSIPHSISDSEVPSFTNPNAVTHMSQTAIDILDNLPEPKSESERMKKFDSGFYDLIKDKIKESGKPKEYHDVIIFVNRDDPTVYPENYSPKSRAEMNKNIVSSFLKNHNDAKDVFIGKVLSIVIASVPTDQIHKLGDYIQIKSIGDGEQKINLALDNSKDVINSLGLGVTGIGSRIAIIDSGIDQNHNDLPIPVTIIDQITCGDVTCPAPSSDYSDQPLGLPPLPLTGHGTHVAGIIVGIGNIDSTKKGVAPDAKLLNIKRNDQETKTVLRGLDYALEENFKIINISLGLNDTASNAITLKLGTDEAVDLGAIVVVSAGNEGPDPTTVTAPGSAFNVITVGNMDDKNGTNSTQFEIRNSSGRGPTSIGQLKPELVAPGVLIDSPGDFSSGNYAEVTGTSYSAPHVTGSTALILEKYPEFDSLEIKGSLFVGADWRGNVPYSADLYESSFSTDIPNAWGFGLIDVEKSIEISDAGNKIIRDTIVASQTKEYSLDVINNQDAKVFLIWENHPNGTIIVPSGPGSISNLDFQIFNSADSIRSQSISDFQNIEFGIFTPDETSSQWKIKVTANSLQTGTSGETFVLASDRPIAPLQTVECYPRDMTPFDWYVHSDCTLFEDSSVLGNVTITNNAVLTIPNGKELDIDFSSNKLLIESGSGVLIQSGGTVT